MNSKIVVITLKRNHWTKYPEKFLTINKSYDVIKSDQWNYLIKDDRNKFRSFSKNLFITLDKWRELRINSII